MLSFTVSASEDFKEVKVHEVKKIMDSGALIDLTKGMTTIESDSDQITHAESSSTAATELFGQASYLKQLIEELECIIHG